MHLSPLGDRALLIHLGDSIDEETHRRVRAVCARLEAYPPPGLIECVPAYASVAVHYEPAAVAPDANDARAGAYARFAGQVREALARMDVGALPPARVVELPVCYGGEHGPDLLAVAAEHNLEPNDVVRLHTEGDYLVYMLGFAPGFAYLGGLSPRIATPRHTSPRAAVPAGSVGIGGSQTGVYAIASPGGWQLIGQTPLRLFDVHRTPTTLLATGDRVRFRAIPADEYDAVAGVP